MQGVTTLATRIVCTTQSNPSAPGHGHIVAVGTGTDPDRASGKATVDEVRRRLANGEAFYTQDAAGHRASVRPFDCSCGIRTIRSAADATTANNLDNLRACNWQ